MLDLVIVEKNIDKSKEVIKREIVRGIMIRDNQILLVKPGNEDIYGTPGGGIDPGETQKEALYREMREETGAQDVEVIKYLGKTDVLRVHINDSSKYINPIMHYFLIDVKEFGPQELIEYEQEIGLEAIFVDIDEAIRKNEIALNDVKNQKFISFYTVQTDVLKWIKNNVM